MGSVSTVAPPSRSRTVPWPTYVRRSIFLEAASSAPLGLRSSSAAAAAPFLELLALRLGLLIRARDQLLASGPAEDPADEDHREDHVPRRGDQLLGRRVGGGGGRARLVLQRGAVHCLSDSHAAGCHRHG